MEVAKTIEDRIKRVIAEQLGVAEVDVKPETRLIEDLGADSLDEVELIMAVEDEFEIDIPDDDAGKIKTAQQAIDYIKGRESEIA